MSETRKQRMLCLLMTVAVLRPALIRQPVRPDQNNVKCHFCSLIRRDYQSHNGKWNLYCTSTLNA